MHLILFKSRRLKRADYALTHGAYQKAFRLALPLVDSVKIEIAFLANRMCGLALYKRKKYEESLHFLEKTCHLRNYRHDWYNLAMASAFCGNLEKAEEAFKNIYRSSVQPGYLYATPVPGLLFQYMKALKKKQFIDAAKIRANELKQMYVGVGKDISKQVQRGLPAYPAFQREVESLFPTDKVL
ncbi:hypothetical protein [Marinilabilia salmonicolor]|uniref:hypothetical protein n=1 Tax=Marinilabilia salmonicolor TaxID=989 RepID=UPI00029AC8A3|nr:hypothetical protein [Marinilabilia salmonicolor]